MQILQTISRPPTTLRPQDEIGWTIRRVELLTELWAEGLSASLIADKLGVVTRSAVLGKVFRLGLPGHTGLQRIRAPRYLPKPVPVIKLPAPPKKTFVKPVPPKPRVVSLQLPEPEPRMLPLLALTDDVCRFPIGDPLKDGFGFCGHPKEREAYCACHAVRSYQRIDKGGRK